MSPIKEFRVGDTDIRIEEDLIFVRPHGSMTQEQLPQLTELLEGLHAQHGQLFLLADLKEGKNLGPAMRRAVSQVMGAIAPAAMAVFGANIEQRAMHALVMGAVTGVSGQRPNVEYFRTEAEARQWLAAERQRLLAPHA